MIGLSTGCCQLEDHHLDPSVDYNDNDEPALFVLCHCMALAEIRFSHLGFDFM
jgi:hypothetical protein